MSPEEFHHGTGIRGCTSVSGPGDPRWPGGPNRHVIRWILDHTAVMVTAHYWKDGGTWKKLESPADFAALNLRLDGIRRLAVL